MNVAKVEWTGPGRYGLAFASGEFRVRPDPKGVEVRSPGDWANVFFIRLSRDGRWECGLCRRTFPGPQLGQVEVERHLLPLCPACLSRVLRWRRVPVYRKEVSDVNLWRDGDGRLFVLAEDPLGTVEVLGRRYRVVREVTDPRERLSLDPLGEIALALGLRPCPYHPEVFFPEDGACPRCLAEAEDAALEALREAVRS